MYERLNVCVCTLCVQCPWRQEERIRCPATGVTIDVSPLVVMATEPRSPAKLESA